MYTEEDMNETENMIIKEGHETDAKKFRTFSKEKSSMSMVKHPNHYTWHPKSECIDIIQYFPYNQGAAIGYIWRCERKGNKKEDLEKAIMHLQFELKKMEMDVLEQPGQARGYRDR